MTHWHVAMTAPRGEAKAEAALREIGVEVYVPRETDWRTHARRKTRVQRPIFPRYLFFRGDSYYAVGKTEGVERIVYMASCPAIVPLEWLAEIKAAQELGKFDYTRTEFPTFATNDPVKIIGGPFAGQLATIMQAKPGEARVRIFLEAMNRVAMIKARDLKVRDVA